jgi:hypothetical protein
MKSQYLVIHKAPGEKHFRFLAAPESFFTNKAKAIVDAKAADRLSIFGIKHEVLELPMKARARG